MKTNAGNEIFQSKSLLSSNQATIVTTLRNWYSFMLIQDDFLTLLLKVGFHMIEGSQTIAEDRTWFAADRRSVFPYDRRTFCDLRSAIVCDHMETNLNRDS